MNRLETALKPILREATALELYQLQPGQRVTSVATKFGGSPYAEIQDEWPLCPSCGDGLTFICQVNAADCFHRMPSKIALFSFFYCTQCSPWGMSDEPQGQWLVRVYSEPSETRFIELSDSSPPDAKVQTCGVHTSRVLSLPDLEGIGRWFGEAEEWAAEMNPEEPWEAYDEVVSSLGAVSDYGSLLGGFPRWVQGEATPECPKCRQSMALLAQIDSEEKAGITWGDQGLIYLFICNEHTDETHMELQCY